MSITEKKLYALTDEQAAQAKDCVDRCAEIRFYDDELVDKLDGILQALTPVTVNGLGGATIERMARAIADLEPGEPWPTNEELGGGPTGTRDDEYLYSYLDRARAALAALLGGGQE